MKRTYSELIRIDSFYDRFEYLNLRGSVGIETFGSRRYVNQSFYFSKEWRDFRKRIIVRDNGCDMGHPDFEIAGRIYIHHIVPITIDDIVNHSSSLLDEDNVVCVSQITHEAIHYGDESLLPSELIERKPGDTNLW